MKLSLALATSLSLAVLSLAACGGSSPKSSSGNTLATLTLTSTTGKTAPVQPGGSAGSCHAVIARTIGEVAARIYQEARHGDNVAQAVGRVKGSTALRKAISSGDTDATEAALRALLVNQIVRIEIRKGGQRFASVGSGAAIAPVSGVLPGTDARFVLSTQAASAYAAVTRQVTGADTLLWGLSGGQVVGAQPGAPLAALLHDRPITLRGRRYQSISTTGEAYPSGLLHIAMLVPTDGLSCPGSAAQTRVETLGRIGERIYQEELHSSYVLATLRHIEADRPFLQAVAARDSAAIRAAIVGLFAAHIHVVRVHVNAVEPSGAQRFLYDLGGPYVLAPVHGSVRSAGKLVGRFSFAIQDDAGYLKLAHLFTGAQVLMRVGGTQVMGTLDPGPAHVPDRGPLDYRGQRYEAYSFSGTAFPSGTLRISLLLPGTAGSGG